LDDQRQVYRGPSQASPGNDIHAGSPSLQKAPTRGPASLGLSNLAGLLTETNRHAEAEPLYRRALAIFEKSFGPDHPNVGIVRDNLASLMKDTNRQPKAETT
jgi:hypothetical protein